VLFLLNQHKIVYPFALCEFAKNAVSEIIMSDFKIMRKTRENPLYIFILVYTFLPFQEKMKIC